MITRSYCATFDRNLFLISVMVVNIDTLVGYELFITLLVFRINPTILNVK